ncbi:PREDICTED: LOW QUALITY PROTEIN: L-threonine 3-dehydrogenase, mitochondrial-like [Amphimedon queenslandica]|uniref:L-threonine 3-dehydrogenase, mitochondrial n=1 Tax=Amphimedon queenslandica TaxID=400682 RepID=A0AAN0IUZ2_AMPQE|nr:PREDICTED: LOW QUALITY PROTEIN: L-threonine 3-dehydrogenase, mitochondrial-like [Amphimedon queenslandica]|eukprot:XP_011409636.1 PREDICTED: LOW QUALITY PROTEIN: L-threonine 3-dehydrogenase, mitochondrial-like [Amphimedon queenslandica]
MSLSRLFSPLSFSRRGLCLVGKASQRSASTNDADNNRRVLITGGMGQLGTGMAKIMRNKYGNDNVILSDIKKPTQEILSQGPYLYADVLDIKHLNSIVVNYGIDWVVHFSALLSAVGELNPRKALEVNVDGFHNIVESSSFHKLRLFSPSTIGAFGPDSPKVLCPDLTIMRPRTVYGVSKVHMELLGEYYSQHGLDFRSLRFPGVIGADTEPGGGTTDYAVHIFHSVAKTGHYSCFLKKDTRLPMIYIDDCLRAAVEFMEFPSEALTQRTYNVTAMSFSPEELVEEMKRYYPKMRVDYEPDERKQSIAESWPQVLDDIRARSDWGWKPDYDISRMVKVMIEKIDPNSTL